MFDIDVVEREQMVLKLEKSTLEDSKTSEESREERARKQMLIQRYDEQSEEIIEHSDGEVEIVYRSKTAGEDTQVDLVEMSRNTNRERVKQQETQQRQQQKVDHEKKVLRDKQLLEEQRAKREKERKRVQKQERRRM